MEAHAYKQVTAQQLRSFCETARRGSLPCAAAFVRRQPQVRFIFHELQVDEVAGAVDDGRADIGFTPVGLEARPTFRLLTFEPWYHLDVLLITPHNHPLARRRRVALADL